MPCYSMMFCRWRGGQGGRSIKSKLPLLIARRCFLCFHGNWRDLSMYVYTSNSSNPNVSSTSVNLCACVKSELSSVCFEASVFSPLPGLRCTNPEACRGCLKLQVVSRDHKRHCSAMGWSIEEVVLVPKMFETKQEEERHRESKWHSDPLVIEICLGINLRTSKHRMLLEAMLKTHVPRVSLLTLNVKVECWTLGQGLWFWRDGHHVFNYQLDEVELKHNACSRHVHAENL